MKLLIGVKSSLQSCGWQPGTPANSLSSLEVSVACRGPARPTRYTFWMLLLDKASRAWSQISVFLGKEWRHSSHGIYTIQHVHPRTVAVVGS